MMKENLDVDTGIYDKTNPRMELVTLVFLLTDDKYHPGMVYVRDISP